MRMVKTELPKTRSFKLQEFIRDFIDSDMETAEAINEGDYKDVPTMYNALKVTVTRSFPTVKVVQVRGHVYLTRQNQEKV